MSDSTAADGAVMRARGEKTDKLQEIAGTLDPDLPGIIDSLVFGTFWTRPGLEFEERMVVAIGALAASGKPNQLRSYLFGALEDGMLPIKIHEAVMMTFVYGRFPNAIEAPGTWKENRRVGSASRHDRRPRQVLSRP